VASGTVPTVPAAMRRMRERVSRVSRTNPGQMERDSRVNITVLLLTVVLTPQVYKVCFLHCQ
jgi:hypothetical protein